MNQENITPNQGKEQENSSLNVGEIVSNSEKFIEKNKKIITIIISVIVLGIAAYFLYQSFVVEPREKRVQEELFAAQKYFEQEDFKKALEGDGKHAGLISLIEEYVVLLLLFISSRLLYFLIVVPSTECPLFSDKS